MPKPRSPSGTNTVKTSQTPKTIRVLLLSRHVLIRSGIRALLERIENVEVGEGADNQQILASISKFNPDVVLLEFVAPGIRDLELLKLLAQKFPLQRVVVLIQLEDKEQAFQAVRLGVAGLIAKSAVSTELEVAIKAVANGETYISEVLRQVVVKYSENPPDFLSELTPRQYEVLKLIAEGHTTQQIALRLNIGAKTVETHRARIMERLNIRDIAGLVRYALRKGLIELDD